MPFRIGDGSGRRPLHIGLDQALIVAVAIVDLVLVLNTVLGLHGPGPAFQVAPDPAGPFLPF